MERLGGADRAAASTISRLRGSLGDIEEQQNGALRAEAFEAAEAMNGTLDALRRQLADAEGARRALAAERNAQARQAEQKAQAKQIIAAHAVPHKGDDEYRFSDGAAIRTLLIDPKLRKALSVGVLVIVAHGDGYALLPRAAAEKVRERAPEAIIVDHGQPGSTAEISTGNAEDDAYYAQFQVPDDLVW
jgi:uncharacterized protein YaiL (DUF2058 family)